MLDQQQYPFLLRFRIQDGTLVFPVQSDIENLALHTGQDINYIYDPLGVDLGTAPLYGTKLVFSEKFMGWIICP